MLSICKIFPEDVNCKLSILLIFTANRIQFVHNASTRQGVDIMDVIKTRQNVHDGHFWQPLARLAEVQQYDRQSQAFEHVLD